MSEDRGSDRTWSRFGCCWSEGARPGEGGWCGEVGRGSAQTVVSGDGRAKKRAGRRGSVRQVVRSQRQVGWGSREIGSKVGSEVPGSGRHYK